MRGGMVEKLLILYNPASGKFGIQAYLDQITRVCLKHGYLPAYYRTRSCPEDDKVFRDIEEFHTVLVAGGDGTVSWAVNRLLSSGADPTVGIIPSGTANDFATALGIMGSPVEVVNNLLQGREIRVDVGQVNEYYFINVVSAGLLATVPQEVDYRLKKKLGITAYYLEGLQQLRNISSIPLTLETEDRKISEEALLLLVMNSPTVGTFKNIAPRADIADGLLDVLLVKKCSLPQVVTLLLEVFKGDGKHLHSPYIDYFPARWVRVTSPHTVPTDIDGEPGPPLPLEIKVLRHRLRLLTT